MSTTAVDNKRIAKNTAFLYLRMILLLAINLFTSRVILQALGVEDYGVYNVVGGFVAMFSIMSGSLSSSISRFITFELGKGNAERLKSVFTTSVNIQFGISILVLLVGSVVGGWFLNTQMNIPPGRTTAANWVLCCSLLMFCVNLISVPYNACIIAHERMTAFAYVSILEAVLRLSVCYLITVSPYDKLISYAILLLVVAVIIRTVYGIYCSRHFGECHYQWKRETSLIREMAGFAGWSFLTNACYMFNTQGVNLLINIFFGVTLNAARGIATQVEGAVMQFVNSFGMAINPQITKTYAAGKLEEMNKLVCRGAKFSYFLMLIFALPILYEAEYILNLWLGIVPEHTVVFLRLTIIGAAINMLGNTGYTACMATGNIRRYVLWISSVGCLVFPFTWVAYRFGLPAESTYVIFILVYVGVTSIRLHIMHGLLGFPVRMFWDEVVVKIVLVTLLSVLLPTVVYYYMPQSFGRLVTEVAVCTFSICAVIYAVGLTVNERRTITKDLWVAIQKRLGKIENT